jgi:hypothetical protein
MKGGFLYPRDRDKYWNVRIRVRVSSASAGTAKLEWRQDKAPCNLAVNERIWYRFSSRSVNPQLRRCLYQCFVILPHYCRQQTATNAHRRKHFGTFSVYCYLSEERSFLFRLWTLFAFRCKGVVPSTRFSFKLSDNFAAVRVSISYNNSVILI